MEWFRIDLLVSVCSCNRIDNWRKYMKTNKKITNTFNQNSSVFAVFKPHQLKKKESEQL